MGLGVRELFDNNIKVHFAGSDGGEIFYAALLAAQTKYRLFSCYKYILKRRPDDDFRLPADHVIRVQDTVNRHVIQDSGLFTLMFGAGKGQAQTLESLTEWQDKLIAFVQQNNLRCTCVELDCQKVLGVREAWYFRERMKKLLDNPQINVFHFEDGMQGLDSLIDFSDYIALSIPELRIIKPKTFREDTRYLTHYIKNRKPEMDDLYFKFTVPFEDSEKLGTATIEAYNLSPATRNSIKKGMPIILNAGYEGDIGAIFTGKVSQVSDKHSGTEVITTIAAAEALEEWLSKEVNKTYTAGSKASAIVKDLLNIFGLEVGTMELAVDKEYPRGKVCKGKVKNVLTEIVTSDCKSRFLIRNGIVTINDPKTGTKTGYVLSAESGLLKAAEATDRTETTTRQTTVKDGKGKQEVTYKRECLLNYHLAPADVVKIKSDTLNGNHLIKGGQHTGCPDGDWKTTIEVKPV